jgi:hypothetical protein
MAQTSAPANQMPPKVHRVGAVERLSKRLGLTADQEKQVRAFYADARMQSKPLEARLHEERASLDTAVKRRFRTTNRSDHASPQEVGSLQLGLSFRRLMNRIQNILNLIARSAIGCLNKVQLSMTPLSVGRPLCPPTVIVKTGRRGIGCHNGFEPLFSHPPETFAKVLATFSLSHIFRQNPTIEKIAKSGMGHHYFFSSY